jgi:hypothetical protein
VHMIGWAEAWKDVTGCDQNDPGIIVSRLGSCSTHP